MGPPYGKRDPCYFHTMKFPLIFVLSIGFFFSYVPFHQQPSKKSECFFFAWAPTTNLSATHSAWLDFQTFGFCPSKPPGPSPGRFRLRGPRFHDDLADLATVYVGVYIYICIHHVCCIYICAKCMYILCIHLFTYLSYICVYIHIYLYTYIVRTSWWFPHVWKIWVIFPKPRKRIFNPPPQCPCTYTNPGSPKTIFWMVFP